MNLVLRGNATFGVGDKWVHAARADVLFFHPGQDHVLLDSSEDLELFAIGLQPELAERAIGPSARLDSRGYRLIDAEISSTRAALLALDDRASPLSVEDAVTTLFRAVNGHGASSHVISRVAIQQLKLDPEASAGQLAERLRTHVSAVSRHVHDDLNVRFVEYRARLRLISFVKRADQGMTLSRAAADAGFGSYAQCHRVFTRLVGCTPRHYFTGKRREIDDARFAVSR